MKSRSHMCGARACRAGARLKILQFHFMRRFFLRSFLRSGRLVLTVALAFSACVSAAQSSSGQSATSREIVTLDGNAPAHPFPHYWEEMFGSGRAILSLRESYRDDLRHVKHITGF